MIRLRSHANVVQSIILKREYSNNTKKCSLKNNQPHAACATPHPNLVSSNSPLQKKIENPNYSFADEDDDVDAVSIDGSAS